MGESGQEGYGVGGPDQLSYIKGEPRQGPVFTECRRVEFDGIVPGTDCF